MSFVAVLIDEVVIVGSLEHIDVFDDKWTGLERGENIDFVDSAFLEFGDLFELFCVNHLDGHFLLGDQVNRLVNLRVHTLSQLLFQLVILDYLAHHLIITQLYAAQTKNNHTHASRCNGLKLRNKKGIDFGVLWGEIEAL